MATSQIKRYAKNEKREWKDFRPVMCSIIVGMHLLAAGGLMWHLIAGFWPSTAVIITVVTMFIIAGFGVALGYHRLFTHQGFKCGVVLQTILAGAGAMSAEGPPDVWLRTHRRHHVYADQPGDAHSPFQYGGTKWRVLKGILWSHIGWLFYKYPLPERSRPDDIDRNPTLQWLSKHYGLVMVITFALPAVIGGIDGAASGGWHGLFIGSLDGFLMGILRVVFFLNITWCINSVSHLWGELVAVIVVTDNKNRIYYPSDGSRNAWWWLKILSFGEANHALHHLFQTVAFHGWSKWAIDPSKWMLIALEKIGLVKDIKRPPPHELVKVKTSVQLNLPSDTFIPIERLVGQQELVRTD